MTKIRFIGTVFPQNIKVSISCPAVKWGEKNTDKSWVINIKIENNVITTDCETNVFSGLKSDIVEAQRRVFDLVKAAVNILAFTNGIGFQVVLHTYVDPQGISSELAVIDERLKAVCEETNKNPNGYNEVFNLVLNEFSLTQALDDLIEAITLGHKTTVSCARAVEGIRHMIAPGEEVVAQWEKMNAILRLAKTYTQLITAYSTKPRHGERIRIEGDITTEVAKRSWIIMNRFLEYRKRGNLPLSESEFPTLV